MYEDSQPLNWIAQFKLWNMMRADADLAAYSSVLARFQEMASDSRYAWLTNISDAIAQQDIFTIDDVMYGGIDDRVDTAADTEVGVLMQDDVAADYIVQHYLDYYALYVKYALPDSYYGVLTNDDTAAVLALANLCPLSDGEVVYQAQVLYRIITHDDTTSFDGNCAGTPDTAVRGSLATTQQQRYTLFPNPNDGSFTLLQAIADNSATHIIVQDAFGRRVYNEQLTFDNKTARIQLGRLPSGVYLLQLMDGKGNKQNHKFVVQ